MATIVDNRFRLFERSDLNRRAREAGQIRALTCELTALAAGPRFLGSARRTAHFANLKQCLAPTRDVRRLQGSFEETRDHYKEPEWEIDPPMKVFQRATEYECHIWFAI